MLDNLKSSKKFDLLFILILSFLVALTRIPLVSKFLYEWDSSSYALAFEKYSIAHQQPHAPGYILYVALGKGVNFIFNDANASLVFISIVISILTVIIVYFLAKDLFSPKVALASSILLIFNPLFWFYGELATVYIFQAFFAVLIAYLSYKALKQQGYFIYLSALILGLSGGFRLDMVALLLPLWLFCLWYGKTSYKKILVAVGVLIIGVLLWFVPTVITTGSLGNYMEFLSTVSSAGSTSILFGASLSSQIINSGLALVWSILGLTLFGFLVLVVYLIYHRHKWRSKFIPYLKNPITLFFLLWIAPAFLFFFLIYIIKPGYTLIYLPALAIILGYMVNRLAGDLHNSISRVSVRSFFITLLVIGMVLNSAIFLYPYDLHQGELWETPQNNLTGSQTILFEINVGFMYNNEKIIANDENTKLHINNITNLSGSDPNSTIIVIRDITREDEGFNWRKAMYYLPDYNVYYLFDQENSNTENGVMVWLGHNHTDEKIDASTVEIPLNQSVRRIVWIMSDQSNFFKEVQSHGNFQTINLPNGLKIYVTNVGDGSVDLNVSGFVFKR